MDHRTRTLLIDPHHPGYQRLSAHGRLSMGQNVYPVDLPLEWGLPEHGIFDSGPETGIGGDSGDFIPSAWNKSSSQANKNAVELNRIHACYAATR